MSGVGRLLSSPPAMREPGHVGGDRETGEVDVPGAGLKKSSLPDEVGDLQVVDRAGEPEQRDRAVEEQRDAVDALRAASTTPRPICSR